MKTLLRQARRAKSPALGTGARRPAANDGLIVAEVIGYYGLIGAAALSAVFLR
jgi:hypothetical protein